MKRTGILIMLLLLLLALFSCERKDRSELLYIYNWTYYLPDEIIRRFEEETGIKIIIDNFSSNEEMFTKFMAGGAKGYDIAVPSADYTQIMIKLGMLEKIDHEGMENLKYVSPLVKEKALYDPDMEYSVPYFMGASGIAVNRRRLEALGIDYEKSWSIFADERLKGRMSMLDDMREVLGAALIQQGCSINTSSEEEIAAAAEKVENEWKPNLVKFDAESYAKSFARGEFLAVHCYSESISEELGELELENVDFFIPEEGGCLYIDNMVIPKDAPNYEGALRFIDFFHRPDIHAIFLEEFCFPATTNPEAAKYAELDSLFDPEDLERCELIMDVGADLEKYNKVWEKIRYTN